MEAIANVFYIIVGSFFIVWVVTLVFGLLWAFGVGFAALFDAIADHIRRRP